MGLINVDVGSALSGIGSLAKSLRAAITGKAPIDAAKAAELALKAQELETQVSNAQADINKIEAGHSNLFVAGWRPFVGWTCGLSFAVEFALKPLILYTAALFGKTLPMPNLDMAPIYGVLTAMLGFGVAGLRTYEKMRGVAGRHL